MILAVILGGCGSTDKNLKLGDTLDALVGGTNYSINLVLSGAMDTTRLEKRDGNKYYTKDVNNNNPNGIEQYYEKIGSKIFEYSKIGEEWSRDDITASHDSFDDIAALDSEVLAQILDPDNYTKKGNTYTYIAEDKTILGLEFDKAEIVAEKTSMTLTITIPGANEAASLTLTSKIFDIGTTKIDLPSVTTLAEAGALFTSGTNYTLTIIEDYIFTNTRLTGKRDGNGLWAFHELWDVEDGEYVPDLDAPFAVDGVMLAEYTTEGQKIYFCDEGDWYFVQVQDAYLENLFTEGFFPADVAAELFDEANYDKNGNTYTYIGNGAAIFEDFFYPDFIGLTIVITNDTITLTFDFWDDGDETVTFVMSDIGATSVTLPTNATPMLPI